MAARADAATVPRSSPTTATPDAPASRQSPASTGPMPPSAITGMIALVAQSASSSSARGNAPGLLGVAKMGLKVT